MIKRIFLAIAALIIVLCVISLFMQGNIWLPLMVILGSTIGIPIGLFYPFPLFTKVTMVIGLIVSLAAMIYGFKNSNAITGQVSAVLGIIVWSFIGLMGLGTGALVHRITSAITRINFTLRSNLPGVASVRFFKLTNKDLHEQS